MSSRLTSRAERMTVVVHRCETLGGLSERSLSDCWLRGINHERSVSRIAVRKIVCLILGPGLGRSEKPRAHKIALLLSVVALAFGTRVKARTCSPLSRVRPTACEACDVSSILITRCIFRFGHDGHVFPRGLQELVYDTEHLRRNTVRQMRRTRSPMRLGTRRMKAAVSSDVTCVRLRPTKTGERYYRAVAVQLQRNRFG